MVKIIAKPGKSYTISEIILGYQQMYNTAQLKGTHEEIRYLKEFAKKKVIFK